MLVDYGARAGLPAAALTRRKSMPDNLLLFRLTNVACAQILEAVRHVNQPFKRQPKLHVIGLGNSACIMSDFFAAQSAQQRAQPA